MRSDAEALLFPLAHASVPDPIFSTSTLRIVFLELNTLTRLLYVGYAILGVALNPYRATFRTPSLTLVSFQTSAAEKVHLKQGGVTH